MKKGVLYIIGGAVIALGILWFLPDTPSQESESQVEEAQEERPAVSKADSLIDDALAKMESGELPPMQAVMTIKGVADEYPENVRAQFIMGEMSMRTGQWEKAIGRFKNVISLDESNGSAHIMLVQSHLEKGDTSSAKEQLDRSLQSSISKESKAALEEMKAAIN